MRSRINTSPTLSTTHSHSAESAMDRLASRVAQGGVLTVPEAYRQIAHNIHLLVHVKLVDDTWRGGQRRRFISEIRQLTGSSRYVFPTVRSFDRPMSDGTVLAALRRMGYSQDEMTGHGFRSMASTLLNERGYNRDWIERQLAHGERNSIRAAYNYAEYLPERRKMMQAYADYLTALKEQQ